MNDRVWRSIKLILVAFVVCSFWIGHFCGMIDMKERKMIKLGSQVMDGPTGIAGTVTMRHIDMGGIVFVLVKPKALDPDTGKPAAGFWAVEDRLSGGEREDVVLPASIFGTQVTDPVTGFTGTAIALEYHLTGCVHVIIQPAGQNKKGEAFDTFDVDLRRAEGPAIEKLSAEDKQASVARTPSPCGEPMVRMGR